MNTLDALRWSAIDCSLQIIQQQLVKIEEVLAGVSTEKEPEMPTKSEAFPSPYYKAADVKERPILLTIEHVKLETMPSDGEEKYCASFHERDAKRLVVTPTKWDEIGRIAGTDNSDNWAGTKIVLFGSTARYAGKIVDSIGIRAPKNNPAPIVPKPAPAPEPVDATMDDEIPF